MHTKKGFALLMAVIITSTLLLVSFALSNLAFKELLLSHAGQESQVAFYAADTGVECALFWDTKNPTDPSTSAFATDTPPSAGTIINCNSQDIVNGQGVVLSIPEESTLIGGGGNNNPTSTFQILFDEGQDAANGPCAIVRVGKSYKVEGTVGRIQTIIESRGYNTCDVENARRIERALRVVY
jgi:hypothetical protein